MKNKEILTKEYLLECYNKELSSKDISDITGINSRTIRWYMAKYELPVLNGKKGNIPWNKGLTSDDERIKHSTDKAHEARRGQSSWNKGLNIPLSEETKQKLSLALKGKYIGPLNKNWKGGKSGENKLIRMSYQFREWREEVFNRDNHTCQLCNVRGGILHPHHIKGFAEYEDLRFEVSNGITLCKGCHHLIHLECGYKPYNSEMFIENYKHIIQYNK